MDAGRARDNHYGSCVAVYGAIEAKFINITCFAPEQRTNGCYDAKNNGETCNGCLGIIKESFSAQKSLPKTILEACPESFSIPFRRPFSRIPCCPHGPLCCLEALCDKRGFSADYSEAWHLCSLMGDGEPLEATQVAKPLIFEENRRVCS